MTKKVEKQERVANCVLAVEVQMVARRCFDKSNIQLRADQSLSPGLAAMLSPRVSPLWSVLQVREQPWTSPVIERLRLVLTRHSCPGESRSNCVKCRSGCGLLALRSCTEDIDEIWSLN
jgi:hypothetical protein